MKKLALAVLTAVTLGSCAEKVELSGAGATFPQPFYNMAFQTFTEKTGTPISYGGIGSGGGIRSLKDGIVDFAGSDAFLSDEDRFVFMVYNAVFPLAFIERRDKLPCRRCSIGHNCQ